MINKERKGELIREDKLHDKLEEIKDEENEEVGEDNYIQVKFYIEQF